MQAAPLRFLGAVLWPISIWTSLTHLEEHPADDYVERTSPIVASAIAFWLCAALLIITLSMSGGPIITLLGDSGAEEATLQVAPRWTSVATPVLVLFLGAIYVIGWWLYAARDEEFPRA
jgi:hypothetical protein